MHRRMRDDVRRADPADEATRRGHPQRLANMLHSGGLRRQPVAVDHPVDDRLPQCPRLDHLDLTVGEAVSHLERRVGGLARPLRLMDLLEQRTLAADPDPA